MKRWLILFAAVLALTGCAAEPEATTPTNAPQLSETQAATQHPGYYDPGNMMEAATGGTVRAYPMGRSDITCVLPMGEDLLMLSGTESTTLTRLTGDALQILYTAQLDCIVDPGSPALQVSSKGVNYYDASNRELVMLDEELTELRRLKLPGEIIGSPVLSADGRNLYYCAAESLRCIDLETGLNKLLKEMSYSCRTLTGLHCADTILACSAEDDQGDPVTLYLSTQTGETIYQLSQEISLWTEDQNYFAIHYDGAYPELLAGIGQDTERLLDYADDFDAAAPIQALRGVVLASSFPEEQTSQLRCYDLETGTLTASVTIPGSDAVRWIQEDETGRYIWFLRYDSSLECDILCRWDPSENPVSDDTTYLGERHDAQNPDEEGLKRCAKTAEKLSKKHGVEILIWNDAAAYPPEEGILTAEYQVPLIESGLQQLDTALSRYPEGFLEKAAAGTESGTLKICLVRSLGNGENGLQYWTDDSACIALCPGKNLEQNFHHQLFYLLENRVLSTCSVYDTWNSLNPEDFSYALDVEAAAIPENNQWLEGETRAFIDASAMTFPRVDRATIMEYAMMSGNQRLFESETMQNKLRKLSLGIREAFELEDSNESFRWEQYLNAPLYE